MNNPLNAPSEILSRPWRELDFVGFDTETTGKYPLSAEVCEMAALKWRGGKVVDTYQTLLKPSREMDAEVIAIHGITNAMVENAPRMAEKIGEFHQFIQGAIPLAHHAPFDLGFISIEFEKHNLPLPVLPPLCTSLLSRRLFPESRDHKLQTLIPFFGIEKGQAHRALDDARACLEVGLRCLAKVGEEATLGEVIAAQAVELSWQRFSLEVLESSNPFARHLTRAIREGLAIEMVFGGGSSPGQKRRVQPLGIVRSLDGDFIVAYDEKAQRSKRFALEKISAVEIV
jgi:DNA polymerase III subunit epsilon